jgi:hypothetical protein
MKTQIQRQTERINFLKMKSGIDPKVLDIDKIAFCNLIAEIFNADYLTLHDKIDSISFHGCHFVMVEDEQSA